MKPILFPKTSSVFTSNGLGALDPIRCVVTEERNGEYELECEVPVDSAHFSSIDNDMILVVIPSDGGTRQAFRIYRITEPLNGIVTINARHISYDLSYNTAMPYSASSVTEAFVKLKAAAVETCPFTFWTDKSTSATQNVTVPRSMRACLGGQAGSILDVYGGEYQWDNYTVKLYNQRGSDTAVTLRYGKNITDITQEQNLENVITGIVPYWANETTTKTLPQKSVDSQYAFEYPFKRTIPVDFSSEWEEEPTDVQLLAKANAYITANRVGLPKISIKVSFVALWQTEEYKDIAPLERVKLCDTVGVIFEKYNINTRAEVVRTEWDCLTERYLSIDLGEPRSNMASTLVKMNEDTQQEVIDAKTDLQLAIDRATAAINGANGGYVKIKEVDGKPTEILIMNAQTEAQATKIWRWNLGGLGYSNDGGTTYSTAITQDGEIVANFITTGTLTASIIKAGILSDKLGINFINLETGAISLGSATKIGNKTVDTIATEQATAKLNSFVTNTYTPDMADLESQIDKKAETWYQSSDPSSAWTTTALKDEHVGDLWYKTTDQTTWIYRKVNSTYQWSQENVPTAVFDAIDGKAQIFTGTTSNPTVPYFKGDLWFKGSSYGIYTSMADRTDEYHAEDWVIYNKYTDDSYARDLNNSLNATEVFKRLTDDGRRQGIFTQTDQYGNVNYFFNGSHIASGSISDPHMNTVWDLVTGALTAKKLSIITPNFKLTEAGKIVSFGPRDPNYTFSDYSYVRTVLENSNITMELCNTIDDTSGSSPAPKTILSIIGSGLEQGSPLDRAQIKGDVILFEPVNPYREQGERAAIEYGYVFSNIGVVVEKQLSYTPVSTFEGDIKLAKGGTVYVHDGNNYASGYSGIINIDGNNYKFINGINIGPVF